MSCAKVHNASTGIKKFFFFVKSVWKCIYIHYHAESSIYKMKCHVEEMLRAQQFCP